MYTSLNFLKLVYPPISNQLAEWLSEIDSVREYVKHSKFYMLAQRHELFFSNYGVNQDLREFYFDLECSSVKVTGLSVSINQLIGDFFDEIEIEIGKQHVRIWDIQNKKGEPLYWATTDKILYDFWRKRININGLDNVLPFTTFDLYYVGISKDNDSFSRLFDSGHKNRLKILSNETQYTPTARLTDELYIFLFDIEDLSVKQLNIDDFDIPCSLDKKRLVADAEKAFIKLLDSKYNQVKYKNYPAGDDGLANEGLTSYGYVIDEDITFKTSTATIRGAHNTFNSPSNHPDLISIENDEVFFITSEMFESINKNNA
ncbi:TPA: hypothetical protein ACIR5X_004571 [Serratia marcescens]|uniref:hypothetical protein n=1 Tax=unclassified Klebsiella TaxID=2608929 RepID=UPI0022900F48|nr:hypothetical protein [Enterobacter cloacae]